MLVSSMFFQYNLSLKLGRKFMIHGCASAMDFTQFQIVHRYIANFFVANWQMYQLQVYLRAVNLRFGIKRQQIKILDFIFLLIIYMFTFFLRRRAYFWWGKCGMSREFHTRTHPNTGARSAATRIVFHIPYSQFPGRVPPGPLYPVLCIPCIVVHFSITSQL